MIRPSATAARPEWCESVGDDPAIDHAEAADRGIVASIQDRSRRTEVGVARDDRVLGVKDERTCRIHPFGEDPLDLPVRLERAVPVQVVGCDVRVDRDRRAARQRRQLQLGQLVDDPVVGRQLGEPVEDRHADVPAEDDGVDRVRGEDRGRHRACGGLALGPRYPDRRRHAQPEEQVRLRDQCRCRRVAGQSARPPAAWSADRRRGSVVGKAGLMDGDVVTRRASTQVEAGSTSGPSASWT